MFNQRKNKRFNYKPHFRDVNKTESENDLEAKWKDMRSNTKRHGSVLTSMPVLIIILGSIFVLIYVLNRYI